MTGDVVGKVIATHTDSIERPVVRAIFQNKKRLDSCFTIDMKEQEDARIIKTIDGRKLKLDHMVGF